MVADSIDINKALDYQDKILVGVSRTFALTIPELPKGLRTVVANAYLLCRIADTIEDEPALGVSSKTRFQQLFSDVLAGQSDPHVFANELAPLLSDTTMEPEHELIQETALVVAVTHSFSKARQNALFRCVRVMGRGMSRYQQGVDLQGLPNQRSLDDYCYFVAGVVGEMLTELFCLHDPAINRQREQLMPLAASFGQALQMTNILKDVWADRQRGVCWWPHDDFASHGIDLGALETQHRQAGFQHALNQLIGIAHGHICNALQYTLLIPRSQTGIRQFCLWALGLAILTLRNIHATPEFRNASDIKVSRRRVKQVILLSRLCVRSNGLLKLLFKRAGNNLPLHRISHVHVPDDSFANCDPLPDSTVESASATIKQQQFG